MLAGWAPSFAGAETLSMPDEAGVAQSLMPNIGVAQSLAANTGRAHTPLGGDMMDSVLEYVPLRFAQRKRPDIAAPKAQRTRRAVAHRKSAHRAAFNVNAAAIRPRAGAPAGRVARVGERDAARSAQAVETMRAPVVADDWAPAASVTAARPAEGTASARSRAAVSAIPAGHAPNAAATEHATPLGNSAPDPWSNAWLEWSKSTRGNAGHGAPAASLDSEAPVIASVATTSLARDARIDDWVRDGGGQPDIATMNARGVW